MYTRQLETFVSLAKTLSYATTAKAMYISQPAVTQQIAKLEQELGVRLFVRDTRKVALTAAGSVFYEDCRDILSRLNNAKARAKNYARQFQSALRVGCGSNAAIEHLDKLLRLYRHRMPDVHPYVLHGDPVTMLSRLFRKELDVAFGVNAARAIPADAAFQKLLDGRFVCVMPPDAPLARRDRVTIDDLEGQSLIFLEEENCPPEMREVQDRIALRAPDSIVYYSGSALVSATMIKAGIGMAVMPDFACPELDGVCIKPMEEFGTVAYGLFWGKRSDSAQIREFVACAMEVYTTGSTGN